MVGTKLGTVASQEWPSCLSRRGEIAVTRASPPRTFLIFFSDGEACNTLNLSAGPRDARKDIRTVQELLEHKSITATVKYSHLADDHRKAAVEKVKPPEDRN